jgi:hypothetical protein
VEVATVNFRYHPGTAKWHTSFMSRQHMHIHECREVELRCMGDGHAIAQIDNCQFLYVEAQVQPQSSPRWICGGHSRSGVGMSLNTMVCPLPIIPPLIHNHLPSWAGTMGQFEATVPCRGGNQCGKPYEISDTFCWCSSYKQHVHCC